MLILSHLAHISEQGLGHTRGIMGPRETSDEVVSGGWKEEVAGAFPFPATAHHQIPD